MIYRRRVETPGYRAWEWQWHRICLRYSRYAIGENGKVVISLHIVRSGHP